MKNSAIIYIFALSLAICGLTACGSDDKNYDATGIFETTEVIVSAQGQGEIEFLNLSEGDQLKADSLVGLIDTVQLHLKRQQLIASLSAVESKHYDVSRQVAATRQQIETQERERARFAGLVKAHAANQKQVDDIDAQLAVLHKQLAAQTETLENTNRSVSGEGLAIEAQIAQVDDQIARSRIVCPVNGTVLAKYAERGELAAVGRALFKVADVDQMYLRAYVTAPQLTQLKIGQKVTVFADYGEADSRTYEGKITWIAAESEFTPKTIQTRDERANLVYAVKVAVKNDGFIKVGMYGEVKF